jgi:preprotein translocase subunit SecB
LRPEDAPLEVAQLAHAWLASVSFDELIPLGKSGDVEYGIKLGEPKIIHTDDKSVTVMRLTLEIEWTKLPEGQEDGPFELSLDVAGAFMWQDSEIEDDFRRSWIELNAAYLLWPYARSYIATITGLSSAPALTIYTMRVPQLPLRGLEEEEGEVSETTKAKSGSARRASASRKKTATARRSGSRKR